jgi:hypothetical protein
MMITASGEGAQETLADVRRAYEIQGGSEWVDHVEIEGRHGYIEGMRRTARQWLARCWGVQHPPDVEEEVVVLPEEALHCTETGQVSTSLGGETVFTLNRKMAEKMAPARPVVLEKKDAQRFQKEVRRLAVRVSYFQGPETAPEVMETHSETIVYQSEAGIEVPGFLFRPEGEGPHPGVVVVHGQGKDGAATSGWLQKLVDAGRLYNGMGGTPTTHFCWVPRPTSPGQRSTWGAACSGCGYWT